ncbi:hypothetical protein VB773_02085 [Haloarculaceae archaeon H-GB2-1]|nr:hypothetical protein [Haloarculaceae archaeon H-GB1-1]MEA5388448.1 hypothetical protein [Haloarculaceae archaeon H-GB11]MEA5406486.1 hypothetical protein [Haloarculaceae archaeon H-GB2-1]
MAEEWDNLVILDACRYDVFEEMHTFPGTLKPIISKGEEQGILRQELVLASISLLIGDTDSDREAQFPLVPL